MHDPCRSPASPPRHVTVVGAGIVGACVAYTLAKRGLAVTLVDRDAPGHGCSFGNSGALSPGSIAPLALPGILRQVPAMLRDPESPLFLPLRYLPRALPWLLRFVAAARPERVTRAARALAALHEGAIEAHVALADEIGVPDLLLRRGHLHLYPDGAALAKDALGWQLRREYGYPFEQLDRAGILSLEPAVPARYTVGVFLPGHATIREPLRYVEAIVRAFIGRGGTLLRGVVESVQPGGEGCSVRVDGRVHACDAAVIAAGAWSNRLLAPLGCRLPLESQRGYHVQFRGTSPVSRTVVLADRKVFVTPMEAGPRVGGTVEIAGLAAPPDPARAAVLMRIAQASFPMLDAAGATTWMGHRPCMPDSVPVVGPVAGQPNLWLAVGHGHLGLTDSVNTALRIARAMLPESDLTPAARP